MVHRRMMATKLLLKPVWIQLQRVKVLRTKVGKGLRGKQGKKAPTLAHFMEFLIRRGFLKLTS